ncbi:MAG: hypothetical protein LIO46_05350, partial [Clostridiales bacterium]|nr:hypothetical protein [Clostridiales bacterium]
MKQLIYFELNKIIRRKATIAVTIGCLLLAALLFNLPALQHSADDADGNALSGRSAIAYQQEVSEEIGGSMDNAFIHSTLSQFQETAAKAENTPEDWSVYWEFTFPQSEYYTYFAPRTNLLQLLGQVYGDMATMSAMPLDPDSDFYAARTQL